MLYECKHKKARLSEENKNITANDYNLFHNLFYYINQLIFIYIRVY